MPLESFGPSVLNLLSYTYQYLRKLVRLLLTPAASVRGTLGGFYGY